MFGIKQGKIEDFRFGLSDFVDKWNNKFEKNNNIAKKGLFNEEDGRCHKI